MDSPDGSLSLTQRSYFKIAKTISDLSDHRCRVGAVVVHKHHIISSGHNSASKTHAFQARLDKRTFGCECAGLLHAETDALIPLMKRGADLSGASIFVYRQMRNGKQGMARPCPRCMSVIKSLGIKYINYTTADGFAEEVIR